MTAFSLRPDAPAFGTPDEKHPERIDAECYRLRPVEGAEGTGGILLRLVEWYHNLTDLARPRGGILLFAPAEGFRPPEWFETDLGATPAPPQAKTKTACPKASR